MESAASLYDTLDSSLILTAYQEIGFRAEDLRLYVAEQRLLDPGYLDYLMGFTKITIAEMA